MPHGSHWQLNEALFRDVNRFNNQIISLKTEISRSNETFIEHYKNTYTEPVDPPSWMSLEVSSFGLLSQMFRNLKKSPEKIAVVKHFGLNNIELLENWMLCFSHIRNTCAHHGRLWNRRLTAHITLPKKPSNPFIQNRNIWPYKPYAALCCMQYILQTISPDTSFKAGLKALMKSCPLKQEKEMGFSEDWRSDPFWKWHPPNLYPDIVYLPINAEPQGREASLGAPIKQPSHPGKGIAATLHRPLRTKRLAQAWLSY